MANITIRETIPVDLPEIFRIRTDPLVAPHQYKFRHDDTIEIWTNRLNGDNKIGPYTFRCSTVLSDLAVIGYVNHLHWCANDSRLCQCGWDLDPKYWGRGVMCNALAQLFDNFFDHEGIQQVFVDCFRDNQRCLRVLEKLGFVSNPIPLHHRLITAWATKCVRWILRFRLDAELWRNTNQ